jgi:hypothetical protein
MRNQIRALFALVLLTGAVVAIATWADSRRGLNAPSERSATDPSSATDGHDAVVPTQPARRAPDQAPPPPPALPPGADAIIPLTLDVTIHRQTPAGRSHVLRQTITRTPARVHVAPSEGPDWLYERNPTDTRRASGFLIDHAARTIVFHSDSDLRNMLAIAGWAHVNALGFDAGLLAGSKPSDDARTIDGIPFTRFDIVAGGQSQNVWWNAEQSLPAAFVKRDHDGSIRYSVERIRRAIDENVLRPPASRFPDYRNVDLADWLEHH